jgi:hypothetical protein
MNLPDGYVIPYNEKTEMAYRAIFEVAVMLAKRKKEQVFCEVPSTYEGGQDEKQLHDRWRHSQNRTEA